MKVLIDTNIVIDALTAREPWNKNAEQIFFMAANHIAQMYITANTATDIYYLLRKYLKKPEEAKQTMSKLFSLFGILDVTGNNCIVTRNINDYKSGSIRALLPEEFIAFMEQS